MKLLETLKKAGKKALYGVALMLLGFAALAILAQEKGQYVVAIVLGIYGIFVTGHSATDIMATKTVVKTKTEEGS